MLDNKGRSREMWQTARYRLSVSVKGRRQRAHHKGFVLNRRFAQRTAAGQLRNRPRCWRARCRGRTDMTSERTILITGVTGHQGGAVAQALRGAGFHLRGLTRKPDSERAAALARHGV